MRKNAPFLYLISLLFFVNYVTAQKVNTNSELEQAIENATPGTTIILGKGTWTDTYIKIMKKGTAEKPITIKAQTPGMVFLEGNSRVAMGGEYIIIEGLVFRNATNLIDNGESLEPVIKFRESSNNACNNCKLTNVKIDQYNGTPEQEMDKFKWIMLYGQYNEISYCSFLGKKGIGSIINDNRDVAYENYTKIHHNYFADRKHVDQYVDQHNDQDAIRIGNSKTSLSDSYTEVYGNYFNNWSGEIEIISNKSCHNKYYNNTFRDYSGSLTLRHGNYCEVYGNYFIANNKVFSGGIRIMGENHKIYNNYIEATNSTKPGTTGTSLSKNLGAINLINGKAECVLGQNLNGYYQVKKVFIINNSIVNCDTGIRIGAGKFTMPPLDLFVANNIFLMSDANKNAIEQITPADPSSSYTFIGNFRQSGSWKITGSEKDNEVVESNLLTPKDGLYRMTRKSDAINTGIGNYSFLTYDIFGANRPAKFDVGAEEFRNKGTQAPYQNSDIGTKVGFLGTKLPLAVASK